MDSACTVNAINEVMIMAKKELRPSVPQYNLKNSPAAQAQDKALTGSAQSSIDRPISQAIYEAIDTDLARDNLENDLTAADLQD